ncbi:17581_t:CDS:2, partial [Acaulospora colombiana]
RGAVTDKKTTPLVQQDRRHFGGSGAKSTKLVGRNDSPAEYTPEASGSSRVRSTNDNNQLGVYAELPLDYQVYRLIQGSKEKGMVGGEITRAFNNMNHRVLTKILDRLVIPPPSNLRRFAVKRAVEFRGRERRYRYFSLEGYTKFAVNHGMKLDEEDEKDENQLLSVTPTRDPMWGVELLDDGEVEKDDDFLPSPQARERRRKKKEKWRSGPIVESTPKVSRKRGRPRKTTAPSPEEEGPPKPKSKGGRPKGSKNKKPSVKKARIDDEGAAISDNDSREINKDPPLSSVEVTSNNVDGDATRNSSIDPFTPAESRSSESANVVERSLTSDNNSSNQVLDGRSPTVKKRRGRPKKAANVLSDPVNVADVLASNINDSGVIVNNGRSNRADQDQQTTSMGQLHKGRGMSKKTEALSSRPDTTSGFTDHSTTANALAKTLDPTDSPFLGSSYDNSVATNLVMASIDPSFSEPQDLTDTGARSASTFNFAPLFTDGSLSNAHTGWERLDSYRTHGDLMNPDSEFVFQNDIHSYDISDPYSDASINSQIVHSSPTGQNINLDPATSANLKTDLNLSTEISEHYSDAQNFREKTTNSHSTASANVSEDNNPALESELQVDDDRERSDEVEAGPSEITPAASQGGLTKNPSALETLNVKVRSDEAASKIVRRSKRKDSDDGALSFNKKRKVSSHVSNAEEKVGKQVLAKKRKVFTPASITAALRQKVLTRLLEEHQVIEHSAELVKLYQQTLAKESNVTTTPHVIDKKTLQRAAATMEEKGLLKTYNVSLPLLNGGSNTKLLFLHPSLTPSSPVVKEYVTKMLDRAILIGRSFKPSKIEEVNIEVEPLEEFQRRVAAEAAAGETTITLEVPPESNANVPNSYETLTSFVAPGDDSEDGAAETRRHNDNKSLQTSNEMWWLHTARGYGWINAKMIRAKILHQYLITKISDAAPEGNYIDRNSRTFHTAILIRDLPLD